MEIQHIERGRYKGRIDVPKSIRTMAPGETWHVNPALVNLRSVRNVCSIASKQGDMLFSASCPGYSNPFITIRRIK